MKKIVGVIILILSLFSCGRSGIEKPDNLIEEDKMIDILYDLSLLDALKSQRPKYLEENNINPRTYIYKKYQIDSLQFVKSNSYYASDLTVYKKMYDKVAKRLEDNKKGIQAGMSRSGEKVPLTDPDAPQVK